MLGSLARKLRALGFDTAYYRSGDDGGLIALAMLEKRVILTADRSLEARARAKGVNAVLLTGETDRARMRTLHREAKPLGIHFLRGEPRCSVCGGQLEVVTKASVLGEVPAAVQRRHRLFFRCVSCGHLYWRGTHWRKLMSLSRLLGPD